MRGTDRSISHQEVHQLRSKYYGNASGLFRNGYRTPGKAGCMVKGIPSNAEHNIFTVFLDVSKMSRDFIREVNFWIVMKRGACERSVIS